MRGTGLEQDTPFHSDNHETKTSETARPALLRLSTFDSLQFRDFRWLWLGSLAALIAMNMQMITRGWLVLRLANDSPFALALVMIAFAVPVTFISPIGGVLADRIPRKYVVMFSQGGNVIMTLILATLDLTGLIRFWHLMVLGAVNGALMAFNMPSRQALVSDLVPIDKLMNAISLNNSGMNLSRIIGPALAGVLIIYLDTAGVFYLIAGCYFCAVLFTAMLKNKGKQGGARRKGVTEDIREGLSYAASDPSILGLIIVLFVPALFGFPYVALLPAWAREALDVQSDGLGMLLMIMGVGALTGSLILASMNNFAKRGVLLLIVGVVWGLGLTVFSQVTSYGTAIPLLLLLGLVAAVFMSLNMTLLQTYVAAEMRGRIMSISMMTFGAMPLSAVPFGALAERIGTPNALGLSGLLLTVFTLTFAFVNRQFRKIA
jgi:MFS family permease